MRQSSARADGAVLWGRVRRVWGPWRSSAPIVHFDPRPRLCFPVAVFFREGALVRILTKLDGLRHG